MEYNNNVVATCKYHVIWCPKYRRKVLVNGVDTRLQTLIKDICETENINLIESNIAPDYVDLTMEVDPQFGIHKAIKLIKRITSHQLRQEFPWLKSRIPSLWTNAYFVTTIGEKQTKIINDYLKKQHHI